MLKGLLGAIVITPAAGIAEDVDVDGAEVNAPTTIDDRSVLVPAGGRADLAVRIPKNGQAVRVDLAGAALIIGPSGATASATRAPSEAVDLLTYGSPAAIGFDPAAANRIFDYKIGRWPGFVNGKPGVFWTINGHLFPNVPMFMVAEGDIVRMRMSNHSGQAHPMHLHGHHVLVLARDGYKPPVAPGGPTPSRSRTARHTRLRFERTIPACGWIIATTLVHAKQSLVAHLMYQGVTTRFRLGRHTANHPE